MNKVSKVVKKNQKTREEILSTKYRKQAIMRFENLRARDIQTANEITAISIVTPAIAQLDVSHSTHLKQYLVSN